MYKKIKEHDDVDWLWKSIIQLYNNCIIIFIQQVMSFGAVTEITASAWDMLYGVMVNVIKFSIMQFVSINIKKSMRKYLHVLKYCLTLDANRILSNRAGYKYLKNYSINRYYHFMSWICSKSNWKPSTHTLSSISNHTFILPNVWYGNCHQ